MNKFISAIFVMFACYIPSYTAEIPLFSKSVEAKQLKTCQQLIERQQWKKLSQEIIDGLRTKRISLKHLKQLATNYHQSPFAHALQATKAIASIKGTGLSFNTIFPIALFIEGTLPKKVSAGETFWHKNLYRREIQYDPISKHIYIHLGTKDGAIIGIGRKKIVSKTIEYHRTNPKLKARGLTAFNIQEEIDAMKELNGLPGLLDADTFLFHKTHPKKKLSTIITKIYHPGSLHRFLRSRQAKTLTLKERLKIACDIMKGLANMHERGYVHRDLGERNYLVDIKGSIPNKRVIHCVIADMGRTVPYQNIASLAAQGNRRYMPPEGFSFKKMKEADYCKSDLFAVGCVLWHLCFKKSHPWYAHNFSKGVALLKKYRTPLIKKLQKKQRSQSRFSIEDQFIQIVLEATDPKPQQRKTAKRLHQKLQQLYKQI